MAGTPAAGCSGSTPAAPGCGWPSPAPTAPPGPARSPSDRPAVRAGRSAASTRRSLLDASAARRPRSCCARRGPTGSPRPCVGAAGMATLGDELRAELPGALDERLRAYGALALAADAVTAYAGALGQRPGAVVAAGTGMIALGTDLDGAGWRRADGWGHLLGDCGGGAWIGRAGLEAAMRAHDGRAGGSAALLARAEAVFGPVAGLPGAALPAHRPARRAGLVRPGGGPLRGRDDPVAVGHPAAGRPAHRGGGRGRGLPAGAAGRCGGADRRAVQDGRAAARPAARAGAERLLPDAELVPAAGDPLDGALRIAAALAADALTLPQRRGDAAAVRDEPLPGASDDGRT